MSAEVLNKTLVVCLRNIAAGHWNVGREPDAVLTVNEYAAEALRSCGLAAVPSVQPGEAGP